MTGRARDRAVETGPDPATTDERGSEETRVADPAGRTVPFVDGPTGKVPLSSELRGDPDLEDEGNAETGAKGGAIAGTSLVGPLGGSIGAALGGAAGAGLDDGAEEEDAERAREA